MVIAAEKPLRVPSRSIAITSKRKLRMPPQVMTITAALSAITILVRSTVLLLIARVEMIRIAAKPIVARPVKNHVAFIKNATAKHKGNAMSIKRAGLH